MRVFISILLSTLIVIVSLLIGIYLYKTGKELVILDIKTELPLKLFIEKALIEHADSMDINFKNNIIVINVLESWCIPCMKEIPNLNKLKKKYSNYNVYFIALTSGNEEILLNKFKKLNLIFDYTILYEQSELISSIDLSFDSSFKKLIVPQNIVISETGKIDMFFIGASDENIFLIDMYLDKFSKKIN